MRRNGLSACSSALILDFDFCRGLDCVPPETPKIFGKFLRLWHTIHDWIKREIDDTFFWKKWDSTNRMNRIKQRRNVSITLWQRPSQSGVQSWYDCMDGKRHHSLIDSYSRSYRATYFELKGAEHTSSTSLPSLAAILLILYLLAMWMYLTANIP